MHEVNVGVVVLGGEVKEAGEGDGRVGAVEEPVALIVAARDEEMEEDGFVEREVSVERSKRGVLLKGRATWRWNEPTHIRNSSSAKKAKTHRIMQEGAKVTRMLDRHCL
jgi:hypothetical protein